MPASDSTPNFDFLDGGADSGVDQIDPPASATPAAEHVLDSSPRLDETADLTEKRKAAREKATQPAADDSPTEPAASETSASEAPARDETPAAKKVRRGAPTDKQTTADKRTASGKRSANKPAPTDEPADEASARRSRSKGRGSSRGAKADAGGFDWNGIVAAGGKPVVLGLASYATLATGLLIWSLLGGGASRSALESLPDVAPRGENEFRYVPPSAAVPTGHRVGLGESEQFGHILVEPLGITRGPVSLSHYSGRGSTPPDVGGEALQLRLRLTNTSPADASGQVIAPLDSELVYDRLPNGSGQIVSNQYLYNAGETAGEPPVMMLPLAATTEWVVDGQAFPRLAPGESVETLLAAGPQGLDALGPDAVWRLQLRKGYHDRTGHGVTTLVEVPFDAASVPRG